MPGEANPNPTQGQNQGPVDAPGHEPNEPISGPPSEIQDPDPNDDQAAELFGQKEDLDEMIQGFAPISGISDDGPNDPSEDPLGLTDNDNEQSKREEKEEESDEPTPREEPAEKPETPPEETGDEEGDSPEDVIARLRQRIVELETGVTQPVKVGQQTKPEKSAQEKSETQGQQTGQEHPQTPAFELNGEVVQFVKDVDSMREVFASPENFNKFLTQQATYTVEQMIKSLGNVIPAMMQRQFAYYEARQEFLRENPDLEPVQSYLAKKVNEYSAQNPEERDLLKIFNEAGNQTRRDLALARKAAQANSGDGAGTQKKPQTPALVTPGGSRKGSGAAGDNRSGQQKEIDDLIP